MAEHIKCALADIGKPAVIPLIQALNHSHPLVRQRAAWTLGEMSEKKAVLALIDRLTVEENPEVLSDITRTLGQLGDRRALKPIVNLANITNSEYVQFEAQVAIKILGNNP